MKPPSIVQLIATVGILAGTGSASAQDIVLPLTGDVSASPPDHARVAFEVPDGIAEIQIEHDDQSDDNILDWGLEDPNGFRGWGGGNEEPAIVGELAASRSYMAGPLPSGTWNVVIGKAKIEDAPASYAIEVTLRQTPTLAPQTERAPYQAVPALEVEERWYAGDFHVHSLESGDARPPLDEILDFAASRDLDFVVITDHNTHSSLDFFLDAQSRHPDVLLIPGVEWTSYAGHAGAIGATEWVDHKVGLDGFTAQNAMDAYQSQGALLSINHPGLDLGICIGCAWDHEVDMTQIGGVEIGNASLPSSFLNDALKFWDGVLDAGGRPAALGGSDDHRAGVDLGSFQAPIGTPLTMVYASELSVAGILDGVRAGRTVVRLQGSDDPMVELSVNEATEQPEDATAPFVTALAVVTKGEGANLHFVIDGERGDAVAVTSDPFEAKIDLALDAEREQRARVEVSLDDRIRTVTSHVFVAPGEPVVNPSDEQPPASSAEGGGCGCRMINSPTRPVLPLVAGIALAVLCRLCRRRRRAGC